VKEIVILVFQIFSLNRNKEEKIPTQFRKEWEAHTRSVVNIKKKAGVNTLAKHLQSHSKTTIQSSTHRKIFQKYKVMTCIT